MSGERLFKKKREKKEMLTPEREKEIRKLMSLDLEMRDAISEIDRLREVNRVLRDDLEDRELNVKELLTCAGDWMHKYDALKEKYEPSEIAIDKMRDEEPKEKCPNCGNEYFSVARDMSAIRDCKCGISWLPAGKK